MEPGLRAVSGVGSCAKLLDKLRRPDHGFEIRTRKARSPVMPDKISAAIRQISCDIEFNVAPITPVDAAVQVENRRNHSPFHICGGVPDDVGFGLFDLSRPRAGPRLARSHRKSRCDLIPRTGREGKSRGVNKDKRRLRLDGVADFAVAHRDFARPDLLSPKTSDGLANGAESPVRAWRHVFPHGRRDNERHATTRL